MRVFACSYHSFWDASSCDSGSWFRFYPRPAGPSGEIVLGFRLRAPTWCKGYATEGSCALVRKGFTEPAAERVVAETMAINLASRRELEKADLSVVRSFTSPGPTGSTAASCGCRIRPEQRRMGAAGPDHRVWPLTASGA